MHSNTLSIHLSKSSQYMIMSKVIVSVKILIEKKVENELVVD